MLSYFFNVKHFKDLTAVAGGSSVSAVGAVAVEGAPRLSASTSMFTVTGGTPERQTETNRQRNT